MAARIGMELCVVIQRLSAYSGGLWDIIMPPDYRGNGNGNHWHTLLPGRNGIDFKPYFPENLAFIYDPYVAKLDSAWFRLVGMVPYNTDQLLKQPGCTCTFAVSAFTWVG